MKQPPNNAPLPNDFALKILTLLRCGGVSRSELTQQLQPRPSKKALSAHLEQLERLQLVVRESTGSTDRRWIDGDAVLALSASLARCIEGLTEADKAFVRGLSARVEAVLHRRKLFNSPERIIILNEIAQAPRDIHYIWNKMNAKISRRKILSTLNVFEASGLAFQAPKRAKPLPGLGNELEFRATQLGIEVAEKLRFEGATS